MSDLFRPSAAFSGLTTFVTGGTGFSGSQVVDALAPDNEVRIREDRARGSGSSVPVGAKLIRADVTKQDVVDRSSRTLVGTHSL